MIDQSIYTETRDRLAALDFSAENERIAAIEAERSDIEKSVAKAETRCSELARAEIDFKHDATAIADEIAAGNVATATSVSPNIEAMREERAALRAGIGELNRRSSESYTAATAIQRSTQAPIADALAPLNAALAVELQEAADRLIAAWSAIAAVNEIAQHSQHSDLIRRAGLAVGKLTREAVAPVDEKIGAALEPLRDKGAAVARWQAPTRMPIPWSPTIALG